MKYLYSREAKKENTIIKIGDIEIGNNSPVVIAGPCTITDKDKLLVLATELKSIGVNILRGGAFKPRTSPYSFQGLEEEGLNYLIEVKKELNIPIITEITSLDLIEKYIENVDIIQVGSRNMHNYELLKALGKTNKPILLKRGMSSTYEEWLLAAEYILKNGNPNVILCERGIRTFETSTRNTLDIQAIPFIKKTSHLPIIIDPSHASGLDYMVKPLALAGIIAGADGLIVEVELNPSESICDKNQIIDLNTMEDIVKNIKKLDS